VLEPVNCEDIGGISTRILTVGASAEASRREGADAGCPQVRRPSPEGRRRQLDLLEAALHTHGVSDSERSGWDTANRFIEDRPVLAVLIATATMVALSLLFALVEDRGLLGAMRFVGWNAIVAGSMFALLSVFARASGRQRQR
jgi:hypothetical protein